MDGTLSAMLRRRKPKVLSVDRNDLIFGIIRIVPFNVNYVSRKFKQAVKTTGLSDKLHTHSIRHSFASVLLQRGVSIKTGQELLGHGSLTTTMIYTHSTNQEKVNAVKTLEGQ